MGVKKFDPTDIVREAFIAGEKHGKETDNRLKEIADYYGFTSQADMLTEEAAEFTVALNKLRRGHADAYEHIKEEVADVLVVAQQLRYLLGADEIDGIMCRKLERQVKRIEETEGKDVWERMKNGKEET